MSLFSIYLLFPERLLAAQNPLAQADRPHQLFADAPPVPAASVAPPAVTSIMPPAESYTGISIKNGGAMTGLRWLQFLLVIQIKFISSCLLFWGRGGFRTFQTSIYKVLPLAPATHSLSTSSLFARKIVYSSHTELLAVCPPCLLFDLFCSSPPAVTKIHITFTTITESQATSSNPSHIFPGIVPLD